MKGRQRILRVSLGVFVALAIGEIALRIPGLLPMPLRLTPMQIDAEDPIEIQPLGGPLFTYKPNSTFTALYDPQGDPDGYFGPEGRITYRMNGFGLRGADFEPRKPVGTYRVLCLGDSFTFGEGVKEEDSYPARIEDRIGPPGGETRVEVINAGVQAFGTRLETMLLQRLQPIDPDLVLVGFVLNDATDGARTIAMHEQLRDVPVSALGRRLRIVGLPETILKRARLQQEYVRTTRESFTESSQEWQFCQQAFSMLAETTRNEGIPILVVIFPLFWELDENYPFTDLHETVTDACAAAGLPVLDLLETYRGRPAATLWAHPTDQHPNALAHELAADAIATELSKRGWSQ